MGGDFKFEDYYSIYHIAVPTPITLDVFRAKLIDQIVTAYRRPEIDIIKQSLIDAFPFGS